MLRNPEVQKLLLVMGLVSLIAVLAAFLISMSAVWLVLFTCMVLVGSSLWFTRWRYREIEKLSHYLRKISGGEYSLDVRDNQEGELSILKNEIYKLTLMLGEQKSLLQQDKVYLTNSISDISHQLKTPLTSLMVMADLLRDANLPAEKRAEFTRTIRVQLERMEWLVSSLLKLSKIDAGTVEFKKAPFSVKRLIEKAVQAVLVPMDIKEQTLVLEGEDEITFLGDLNWTIEALINLLKNAVEHTPVGGEIRISFEENVLFTKILITDTGKGIAKEDLPYIFQRFYKGKNASDESVGIGLAMAHSIITSQNGDIQVKSEQDRGTQFQIKFYKQII